MGQNNICKPLGAYASDPGKGGACETVCIHTKKVYDSCRDKDCEEDLRVWPTRESQAVLDRAVSVKARSAELLNVYIDVEPVTFNRGFYTIDVKYFYRVTADAYCGTGRPAEICGLASYSKRVMLFGSEGSAKIFTSTAAQNDRDAQHIMRTNMPTAVVETVEPIVLDLRLVETCGCPEPDHCCCDVPRAVCECFDDEVTSSDGEKRLYVTLGQFSIIRLERDSQLLMPAYDFCIPEKECSCSSDESPCDLFSRIAFPTDEFFPVSRGFGESSPCGCDKN